MLIKKILLCFVTELIKIVFFSVRGATKPEQCQHGLSPLCLYVVLGY